MATVNEIEEKITRLQARKRKIIEKEKQRKTRNLASIGETLCNGLDVKDDQINLYAFSEYIAAHEDLRSVILPESYVSEE